MKKSSEELYIETLLKKAGITINGNQAYDIKVHNNKLYKRVINEYTVGLGEAYMDGWWDCDRLDLFFERVLTANLHETIKPSLPLIIKNITSHIFNLQTKRRSKEVGIKHYDLGNELYTKMLDERMNYSCAYYKETNNLNAAQYAKLDLICKKLRLQSGMRVLDIGCGFGSLAKFMAEKYSVTVVGITISKEQQKYAIENCRDLPIDIKLMDYRDLNGKFDSISSVGMFEHVGVKNYLTYMKKANHLISDDGLFLLHTIGGNVSTHTTDPWIHKYIFPNSMLPSIKQISSAAENLFIIEDLQNIGANYDLTLMDWHRNFNNHWGELKHLYDERFFRMWNYYLLSSAGTFRARSNQCVQVVFSKTGVRGGYNAPR